MAAQGIKLIEQALDFASIRQKVISNNISNVSTLNYKRQDISFDDVLDSEMNGNLRMTNERHLIPGQNDASGIEISSDQSNKNISGYNNVDIDKEMATLAENTLLFKFAAKKANSYYTSIQNVIKSKSS